VAAKTLADESSKAMALTGVAPSVVLVHVAPAIVAGGDESLRGSDVESRRVRRIDRDADQAREIRISGRELDPCRAAVQALPKADRTRSIDGARRVEMRGSAGSRTTLVISETPAGPRLLQTLSTAPAGRAESHASVTRTPNASDG
jgi:hypothetical protein